MTRFKLTCGTLIVLVVGFCFVSASSISPQEVGSIEIFQVNQLPITLSNAELIKSAGGYQLRCSIGNNSDEKLLGFRYSLVLVESNNAKQSTVNRSEGFSLAPYTTKRKTFSMPIAMNLKDNVRFILMVEQVVGINSIWEVVKAKDALDAYLTGDYSKVPAVLRVPNHVDSPERIRVIY
jgi:hypothetical protein